jgi:hypothetical protein
MCFGLEKIPLNSELATSNGEYPVIASMMNEVTKPQKTERNSDETGFLRNFEIVVIFFTSRH